MVSKPTIKLRPRTETVLPEAKQGKLSSLIDIEHLAALPDGDFYRPRKKQISIRLDADILAWFQAQPGRYQSLINKACRLYMRLQQISATVYPDGEQ